MDERDWLILKTLHAYKNITHTAQSLYVSQPALTNRLKQMEKEFGVQIVTRGRRGIQFTPQGDYLAKCADDMIHQMQRIKENVLNMENSMSGTLRLGVSTFFTDYKLPGILKLFKEEYPNVEFKVTTEWSSHITHLIYNQDVHVGFVKGDYGWKDQKRLLFEETICIASKDQIDMERLPDMPRIDYRTDQNLKMVVDHWWGENYAKPPLISIDVDKAGTCKNMVANGLGYAILPSMILDDLDDLHKVELTDAAGKPIIRKSWMFFHEESLQLNIVKAFVAFIERIDLKEIH
ncbi:LysR family transcriptional regulator [Domibacillus enclensis]|uniref:DNA-binding transcriptional regulator, LysR family n=1 Tax=Domibacillus enclensis TaxID=1017273 RepID=A0A1N7BIL4_9BACI|nr:LysR family transcriptional regulator [Domibacillus enclensis]OXS74749.1 LysR family transcriptional regulator [Domibacillus enclensis]SIR51229.1 DNA-binding transcriptional regulator, LysR family [Domibacillus enclensis]